jgi:NMD protein affecting ribosome stability and mRNA decay
MLHTIRRDYDSFIQIDLDPPVLRLAHELAIRRRLRGADCAHLAAAMRLRELRAGAIIFVASDAELLAGAVAEGFAVLDPSTDPPLPAEHD